MWWHGQNCIDYKYNASISTSRSGASRLTYSWHGKERSVDLSYRGYDYACHTDSQFMTKVLKIIGRTY